MTACEKCGLPSEQPSTRARLLGANRVYVESLSCPVCGFKSEKAKTLVAQRFYLWCNLFAEDEGIPPERRQEEWTRREAWREGWSRLMEWDERYLDSLGVVDDR